MNRVNILTCIDFLNGQAAQFKLRADEIDKSGGVSLSYRADALALSEGADLLENIVREDIVKDKE